MLRAARSTTRWVRWSVVVYVVLATGGRAHAQEIAAPDSAATREQATAPWRIGIYVGGARNSPTSHIGVTPGQDHHFIGLDAETSMLRLGVLRLNYAFQVLPYVLLEGTLPSAVPVPVCTDVCLVSGTEGTPVRARAFGVSPFGFELASPSTARVAVFGAAAAGGLIFDHPYPVPEAQRINFTLEYGGGALLRIGHAHWIRAGYKYHHLSNAYLARQNPGVDGNVYYAGYQWSVMLPR